MGGLGSGRPSGSGRAKAESCRSLDVNHLHREGCLRPGWIGGRQWSRDGKEVASMSLRAECNRLDLTYRIRIGGGDWEDVAETVRIVRVVCRYGGARPFFVCPGIVSGRACGRRVAKLHLGGRYFLCRHCYRLAYTSQSETSSDRALRRANRMRQRLGGDPGMVSPFPERPKGMWRRPTSVSTDRRARSRRTPIRSWTCALWRSGRVSIDVTAEGTSGHERTKVGCSGQERRHGANPFQCPAPWPAVAVCRPAVGKLRTSMRPRLLRSSWSISRTGRPRSIWSRSSRGSSGASGGWSRRVGGAPTWP